jgi:probable rRNA maturation factor
MPMKVDLSLCTSRLRNVCNIPSYKDFSSWIFAGIDYLTRNNLLNQAVAATHLSLAITLLGATSMRKLNYQYRNKNYPTNVLAFPYPNGYQGSVGNHAVCGDIVLCLAIIDKEAAQLGISSREHLAHLTIHGFLHIIGYTHDDDEHAEIMEGITSKILLTLGMRDPYVIDNNISYD